MGVHTVVATNKDYGPKRGSGGMMFGAALAAGMRDLTGRAERGSRRLRLPQALHPPVAGL